MMKRIISFLLTLISISGFGQSQGDSSGVKMFNRGLDFYNKGNLDSTLVIWTTLVENKIGIQYDTYGSAFFNIPTIYWQMKNFDKAKEWYKKVLVSDLRDNEETGDLMEPHTNYKHKSAVALAGLYEIDSNYTEVLNWLNKADTVYRYWGFEGSADNVSIEEEYLLGWKIHTLLKLNKKEETIQLIILELICSDNLEGFFKKSEDTLLTLIDKKSFKLDLDNALNNLSVQSIDANHWIAIFTLHELEDKIPISKVYPDRNLPHYWRTYFVDKNQTVEKKYLVNYIKERSFYKRMQK
jgi:tetratricopeptide (TPR) repeat protein